jgi:hypothetical protein
LARCNNPRARGFNISLDTVIPRTGAEHNDKQTVNNALFMKTILPCLIIAASTLLVGACSSHETVPVSTTTTTSQTREVPAADLAPAATSTTTTRTDEVHTY